MTKIDFITALGRLLRDGNLRDAFALDPRAVAEKIQLRSSDFSAWLQLVPSDVEFQAAVLLNKRFDLVKHFAPETCQRPGDKLRALFHQYARAYWPPEGAARIFDAFQFCRHLREHAPGTVAPSEWNRLNFAHSSRRAAIHWVELPARGNLQRRCGFQLFLRGSQNRWREVFLYLGV